MKNKHLLILIPALLISLSSCNKNEETKHVHSYDKNNIDWVFVPQVGGGYEASATFTCHGCKEGVEGHEKEIDATVTSVKEKPTCTVDGKETFTAKVEFEGKEYQKQKEVVLTHPGHQSDGEIYHNDYEHYYKCTECHEEYGNEAHSSTSSYLYDENSHWLSCDVCEGEYNKASHDLKEIKLEKYLASKATCTQNETYYKSCSICGNPGGETFQVAGTMLSHNFVEHSAVSAKSCTEPGNKKYYTCTFCGEGHYYLDNSDPHAKEVSWSEIEVALDHDMEEHKGKDAKCDEDGNLEYYTCKYSTDNNIYKDKDGKETYESKEDVILPMTGHDFSESGNCSKCEKDIKTAYDMKSASTFDTLPYKTLSDIGMDSSIKFTGNTYATMDFVSNPNIDLYYNLNYSLDNLAACHRVYFFNNANEAGLVFHFKYSRSENDGIIFCQVYTTEDYESGTTVVKNDTTTYYFPRVSNIKAGQDNTINIRAYLIDSTKMLYRFQIRGGASGGDLYNLSLNAEDKSNTNLYFDLALGTTHPVTTNSKIRFNSNQNVEITIKDTPASSKAKLLLKSSFNTIYGMKDYDVGSKISMPTSLNKEGYKFIGWYDNDGKKWENGDTITSKLVLTARFVEVQNTMLSPSDFGYETKNSWMDSPFNDVKKSLENIEESVTRMDTYFLFDLTTDGTGDTYTIFGFPYSDNSDTSIFFRFNTKPYTDGQGLKVYFYGTSTSSLGGASKTGNEYRVPNINFVGSLILVHMYVEKTSDNKKVVAGVNITSMANGNAFAIEKEVTFQNEYSITDVAKNKLYLSQTYGGSAYKVRDAF